MNALRPAWTTVCIVAFVTTLSCLIQIGYASWEGLWLDELHTSWVTGSSLSDVMPRAAIGNQSPVYFWIVWLSVSWFGHSELALRGVSIAATSGSIIFACWIIWKWTQCRWATLLVAFLIATDIGFLYYATEARPYAILQSLGLLQFYLFCRSIEFPTETSDDHERTHRCARNDRKFFPRWGLLLVSLVLAYTHLMSVWLFLMEAMIVAGVCVSHFRMSPTDRLNSPHVIPRLTVSAILFGLACLPICYLVIFVFDRKGNWNSVSSIVLTWQQAFPTLISMMCLPLAGWVMSLFWQSRSRNHATVRARRVGLVFIFAIFPLIGVTMVDCFQFAPVALLRYTQVGAFGFPIFAGLCVGFLPGPKWKAVWVAVILFACFVQNPMIQSLAQTNHVVRLRNEDWKTPIALINSDSEKQTQPVFLFGNVIEDREALSNHATEFQEYLLFPLDGLYPVNRASRVLAAGPTLETTHFSIQFTQRTIEQGGAWIVVRGSPELVREIGDELRERVSAKLMIAQDNIQISVWETRGNPVYLLSIDGCSAARDGE